MTDDPNTEKESSDSEQQGSAYLSGLAGTLGTIEKVRQLVQEVDDATLPATSVRAMLADYEAAEDTLTTYQDVASIAAKVGAAQSIYTSLAPAVAVANTDALNYAGTAAALQQVAEQNHELSRNLSAIAHLTQETNNLQSAIAVAAQATDAGQPPDSLIADLAVLRAAKVQLSGLPHQQVGGELFDEQGGTDSSLEERRELSEPDSEIEEAVTPEIEARLETSGIEFSYELPVTILQSILSGPQSFEWFEQLNTEYQDAVVSVLLISITIWLGYPVYAPAGPAIAPAIRTAVLESNEQNE